MSALGQKRTFLASLDDVVGTGEYRRRNCEARRFRRLEVDHQLVLGRRLYRQVAGLFAFEDAINVSSGASILVQKVRPVRSQSAGGNIQAFLVNRRQLIPRGKFDDQV